MHQFAPIPSRFETSVMIKISVKVNKYLTSIFTIAYDTNKLAIVNISLC